MSRRPLTVDEKAAGCFAGGVGCLGFAYVCAVIFAAVCILVILYRLAFGG